MQHVFIFTAARCIHFRNGTIFSVPDPESKLYHGQLGIKPLKLNDVRELAQNYVPPECMWYYAQLSAQVTVRQDAGKSDSESCNNETMTDDE